MLRCTRSRFWSGKWARPGSQRDTPGREAARVSRHREYGFGSVRHPEGLLEDGTPALPCGLDCWIGPGQSFRLGLSLSGLGRLPARTLPAGLPDGAVAGPGVEGRRAARRVRSISPSSGSARSRFSGDSPMSTASQPYRPAVQRKTLVTARIVFPSPTGSRRSTPRSCVSTSTARPARALQHRANRRHLHQRRRLTKGKDSYPVAARDARGSFPDD